MTLSGVCKDAGVVTALVLMQMQGYEVPLRTAY